MDNPANQPFPGRPDAIVFDLDGTLVDTADEFVTVVQAMRARYDLAPLEEQRIRRSVSNGSGALVTLALNSAPSDDNYEALRSEFLAIYATVLGQSARPYPGLEQLVVDLANAKIPWGVATNKFRRFAEPLMSAMNFNPEAGSLVTPCDVTHAKPHPESIILSCVNLGASPGRTVYVGDHKRDIDAGRTAGCFTIAASYGYIETHDDPLQWGADAIAHTSEDLATMIRRMIQ